MSKAKSGGGITMNKVRQVGVKAGPPNTRVVSPAGAANIGNMKGSHAEKGDVRAPHQPLYTGNKSQVPLGNTKALEGSGSGARPGGGNRILHGQSGSQSQHGPANFGSAQPLPAVPSGTGDRGRDILSQFGPDSKGGKR